MLVHHCQVLCGLFSLEGYLCCHDPLSFHNEKTLFACAIAEGTESLMTLDPCDHPVVAASSAFRFANTELRVEGSIVVESGC